MNCDNPFSLQGKTILVTGASSGIGRATAIECSKLGAKIVVSGRNQERIEQTMSELQGDEHIAIAAEITDQSQLEVLVAACQALDGAVLCAGIAETALIPFCNLKKFQKVFNVNFFSQTELVRLLLKKGKVSAGASVVAISSIASFKPSLGNSIYGAGKAALSTWMKYAAYELGCKGIRFNCICPGMVKTPIITGGAFTDEQLKEDMKRYPLGRYGEPEEIAYGAIYLLSDASAWVTGIDLTIDGGAAL